MYAQTHQVNKTRPQTNGRTITWAWAYDAVTRLLTVGRDRALRQATLQLAALQPGEAVLDVGCGTGSLTLLAKAQMGPSGAVHGIDASPEMVGVARRKAEHGSIPVDFRVGLIEALDYPAGSFDVVLSSLMFHHLPGELKRRGLVEIQRVLKPGGRLIIVDIKPPTSPAGRLQMALLFHGALHSGVGDLAELIDRAGFVRVEAGNIDVMSLGYVRGQTPDSIGG